MRLANAVRACPGCDDLNIVVNSGAAAGQDEPHYHVHIIPRREGDGFDIPLPFDGSQMPDRTVLDAYAAQIIAALRDPMRTESERATQTTTAHDAERVVSVPMFRESPPRSPAPIERTRMRAAAGRNRSAAMAYQRRTAWRAPVRAEHTGRRGDTR